MHLSVHPCLFLCVCARLVVSIVGCIVYIHQLSHAHAQTRHTYIHAYGHTCTYVREINCIRSCTRTRAPLVAVACVAVLLVVIIAIIICRLFGLIVLVTIIIYGPK